MHARRSGFAIALALLLAAEAAAAQEPSACAPARTDSSAHVPAIVLRASVSAERLEAHAAPRAEVRVLGCPANEGVRVLERRNLPDPLVPGTYTDVFVSIELLGYLNTNCVLSRLPARSGTPVDTLGTRTQGALDACLRFTPPGENR